MLTPLLIQGCHLVAHVRRVEAVLAKVLSIHNRDGHSQAVTILRNLLASLTTTCLADKNRIVAHRSVWAEYWSKSTNDRMMNLLDPIWTGFRQLKD